MLEKEERRKSISFSKYGSFGSSSSTPVRNHSSSSIPNGPPPSYDQVAAVRLGAVQSPPRSLAESDVQRVSSNAAVNAGVQPLAVFIPHYSSGLGYGNQSMTSPTRDPSRYCHMSFVPGVASEVYQRPPQQQPQSTQHTYGQSSSAFAGGDNSAALVKSSPAYMEFSPSIASMPNMSSLPSVVPHPSGALWGRSQSASSVSSPHYHQMPIPSHQVSAMQFDPQKIASAAGGTVQFVSSAISLFAPPSAILRSQPGGSPALTLPKPPRGK